MDDLPLASQPPESLRVGGPYRALPALPEIPRARYTDEAFYQAEIKHVFGRSWLQVGHVSEFEQPGSYRALDLPLAPVLLVRGSDGVLRAFLNSCRHRGATVVRSDQGCARTLSCPYHSWTYDLSGKLIGYPARHSFPGLVKEDHSLQSLRCELWGGFVFINFDPQAQPLAEWMEPMTQRFGVQSEAPLRIVSRQSWTIACNWKMAVEAFRESYHVPTVHPQTAAAALDGYDTFFELYLNGGATIFIPYSKEIMKQAFSGVSLRASTLERLSGMEDAKYNETTLLASMFPNAIIGFQPMGFPLISAWPLSVGSCRLDVVWYGMDWGDAPRPAEWDKVVSDFTTLTGEDVANLAAMQRSVEADPDKGIPVSTLECLVYQLHAQIDKAIGPENIAPRLRVPDVLEDYLVP
ncbi:MAG: aromatic ring-hydroxylating dioxygenase subunit alpha [Pseudomonadota bacterium]|nr:aromatic ring-hydroxylating dioxygenase subunit alpha [Pseudomonadota bacterium]